MTPAAATPTPPTPPASMPSGCGSPMPNDHIMLPEIISKEPLGPAVRHGDDQWFDIVKWVQFAMLNAEELERHHEERRRHDEIRPIRKSSASSAPKAITASSSA